MQKQLTQIEQKAHSGSGLAKHMHDTGLTLSTFRREDGSLIHTISAGEHERYMKVPDVHLIGIGKWVYFGKKLILKEKKMLSKPQANTELSLRFEGDVILIHAFTDAARNFVEQEVAVFGHLALPKQIGDSYWLTSIPAAYDREAVIDYIESFNRE